MKKYEFVGRLIRYEYLRNSHYGTPRYEIYMISENTGELFHAKTSQHTGNIYGFTSTAGSFYKIVYHYTASGNISIDWIYNI